MELMEPDSIAIIPAAATQYRNRDSAWPFRQDSDFHYLCGFAEPEAVLALIPGRKHGEFLLFCRERDAERELWDGTRAGPEGACARFGADDAFPIGDIDDIDSNEDSMDDWPENPNRRGGQVSYPDSD